jgi:beta-N-acetylhexosaminidase
MTSGWKRPLVAGIGAVITFVAAGSPLRPGLIPPAPALALEAPTLAQLIGQKLMMTMSGTTPDADLLGRVQRGEVGGVILFRSNITSASQLSAAATKLRNAAAAGGRPPLLIATDQEGGSVKRISWAPPTLSPPQMGALGDASRAYYQGKATGIVLQCAGVNNNLAPVADVPSSTNSFMYQQARTWSFSASMTATLSDAFASGLKAGTDVATMKHFPGIGMAALNTDSNVVTITASKSALAPGLLPYQKAISHHIPLIMLSNATYTAYDSANAAGWSHAISVGLLRTSLGFTGVSITDSLDGTAAARHVSVTSLAIKAAQAGTDMILLTSSEPVSKTIYANLLVAAQNGTIPTATLQTSYNRILALKAAMTTPPRDTKPPSAKAPVSRLYSGTQLGASTSPVLSSWSAPDACSISRYVVERRVNGGPWVVQSLATATSPSIAQSLTIGSTYRYVMKATDGAGNTSGWVYGPFFKPLLTQQSGSGVSYGETWHIVLNHPYASGGSLAYSTAAGASATFRFTGYAVSWVAYRGPNRGSAAVYVDGIYKATVNLYSAAYQARPMVYAVNWASNGTHTIKILNLGTAGHPRVDVDAFVRLYAS